MTYMQFYNQVFGKPWKDRAVGPEYFDCWGLVVEFYRAVKGVEIFAQGYASGDISTDEGYSQNQSEWSKSDAPVDDCLVACFEEIEGREVCRHLGIYQKGYCLHAYGDNRNGGQVCCHKLEVLKRKFKRLEYWTHE